MRDVGSRRSSFVRDAILVVGTAVAYYLAVLLGLEFKTEAVKFAVVWPPNGLLAGCLLASRRGLWPALAAAAAAVGMATNLAGGNSWPVSAGFTAVNVAEPLLLAWVLGRVRGTPYRFATAGDVFLLYGAAAAVCAGTGVAGAAVVVYGLGAADFPAVWRSFAAADAMAVMLVAPVVVGYAGVRPLAVTRSGAAETAALAAAGLGLAAIAFAWPGEPGGWVIALRFATFPLLLWAAVRFGPPAAAGLLLLFALVVVWNAGHGRGVFADPAASPAGRLLTVQFFLCLVGLCVLGLAAQSADRRAALAALRVSEERYRLVTDTMEEVFWVVDPATGAVGYVSPGYGRVWGQPPGATGGPFRDAVFPADRAAVEAARAALAAGPVELDYRIVRPDGVVRWVHTRAYPVREGGDGAWVKVGVTLDVTDRKEAELAKEAVIAQLQQAFAEIKTLQGLIPICAWCKKIRDDAGFWQQLEVYLGERTDARFSHGICPCCRAEQEREAGLSPVD